MPAAEDFRDWILRIRNGDQRAAAELVERYERLVRTAVRVRIVDPHLARQFDSADVYQSVLGSFFARAALGQFDLDTPEQLAALLVRMATNKVSKRARWHYQERRDVRREHLDGSTLLRSLADPQSQEKRTEALDLLQTLRMRLTPDEQRLVERRCQGKTWVEIAAELGGEAQNHRKKLQRAIDALADDLGFDEGVADD